MSEIVFFTVSDLGKLKVLRISMIDIVFSPRLVNMGKRKIFRNPKDSHYGKSLRSSH